MICNSACSRITAPDPPEPTLGTQQPSSPTTTAKPDTQLGVDEDIVRLVKHIRLGNDDARADADASKIKCTEALRNITTMHDEYMRDLSSLQETVLFNVNNWMSINCPACEFKNYNDTFADSFFKNLDVVRIYRNQVYSYTMCAYSKILDLQSLGKDIAEAVNATDHILDDILSNGINDFNRNQVLTVLKELTELRSNQERLLEEVSFGKYTSVAIERNEEYYINSCQHGYCDSSIKPTILRERHRMIMAPVCFKAHHVEKLTKSRLQPVGKFIVKHICNQLSYESYVQYVERTFNDEFERDESL
jgi:hypothetical protein